MQGRPMMKERIREKGKELGVDLVGFLNLEDYNSPRSPDPHRYLSTAKSIIVLTFKPLAGAYHYQENTWSKMPSYLYSVEGAGNTAANLFSSRPTDHLKLMRKPFVLPSEV